MAFFSRTGLAGLNSSNAEHQAWIQTIRNVMVAGGWVLDFTDIADLSALAVPVAANTVSGVDIWRSNETTDGCSEVFSKFEYGSGAAAVDPAMWVTSGWGRSGAIITGIKTDRTQSKMATVGASTQTVSAGAGWFTLMMSTGNYYGMLASLERGRNLSPFTFKNQLTAFWQGGGQRQQTITPTVAYAQTSFQRNTLGLGIQAFNAYIPTSNGKVPIALIIAYGKGFEYPSINLIGVHPNGAGGIGNVVKHRAYGVYHNYYVQAFNGFNDLALGYYASNPQNGNHNAKQILTRHE